MATALRDMVTDEIVELQAKSSVAALAACRWRMRSLWAVGISLGAAIVWLVLLLSYVSGWPVSTAAGMWVVCMVFNGICNHMANQATKRRIKYGRQILALYMQVRGEADRP